jgi:hypothetical protein
MTCLRNVHVHTDHVHRKGTLKAGRKGRPVSFEPLPREETGSFAFGRRGVGYGKGFDDWEVLVVVIPNQE